MSDSFQPNLAKPNLANIQADAQLDLRGTPCPINFVRTKLRLEKMQPGQLLEVWLDPGEPMEQVPDSLRMEGYRIEQIEDQGDFFVVRVRCPLLSASELGPSELDSSELDSSELSTSEC